MILVNLLGKLAADLMRIFVCDSGEIYNLDFRKSDCCYLEENYCPHLSKVTHEAPRPNAVASIQGDPVPKTIPFFPSTL